MRVAHPAPCITTNTTNKLLQFAKRRTFVRFTGIIASLFLSLFPAVLRDQQTVVPKRSDQEQEPDPRDYEHGARIVDQAECEVDGRDRRHDFGWQKSGTQNLLHWSPPIKAGISVFGSLALGACTTRRRPISVDESFIFLLAV
ncbi:MAG TPA: hypothetical protein VGP19_11495 [Candidatus Acidoferrales bacterium]|jgi:hypothetical protein|nr:hypothetical protein [Candidatus Acidoferrales bacterium]